MAYRVEKISTLIQDILADMIVKDFESGGQTIISLTRVAVSGNIQEAKVYISALPDRERERIVNDLNRNIKYYQSSLNKKMRTRPVPRIIFVVDTKPAEAQAVEAALEKVKSARPVD